MSKIGARILRQQRAESRAARALIRTLLDDVAGEVPDVEPRRAPPAPELAPEPPDADEIRALHLRDEIRDLERWALLVALVCGGLVAVGMLPRC